MITDDSQESVTLILYFYSCTYVLLLCMGTMYIIDILIAHSDDRSLSVNLD